MSDEMFELKPVNEKGETPKPAPKRTAPKSDAPKRESVPATDVLFGSNVLDPKEAQPKISAAHKKDVETAFATMESLYTLMQMGIVLSGRKETAIEMADKGDQVQASNRQAFESSARLAHQIANVGNISAVGMFAVSNIMYLGGIMSTFVRESRDMRAEKLAKSQPYVNPEEGGYTETGQGDI